MEDDPEKWEKFFKEYERAIVERSYTMAKELSTIVSMTRQKYLALKYPQLVVDNIIMQALITVTSAHVTFMIDESKGQVGDKPMGGVLAEVEREISKALLEVLNKHCPPDSRAFLRDLKKENDDEASQN